MERIEIKRRQVQAWLIVVIVMFFSLAFGALGGPGIPIIAVIWIAVVAIMIQRYRQRIIVDEIGITRGKRHIPWDRVVAYSYWTAFGIGGSASSPHKDPDKQFAAIKIIGADGMKISINEGWKRTYRAVEAAVEQIHAHLKVTGFEPFEFDSGALRHEKKGVIPYSEIDRIVVSADQLSVRQRGKTLEWAGVDLRRLVNPLLFLERCGEQGLQVVISGGQLIPQRVVERMRARSYNQTTRTSR